MSNFGCQKILADGKLCECAKTYTEEQQDSGELCTNADCGHDMGSHTEKTVPASQYDTTGMDIYYIL